MTRDPASLTFIEAARRAQIVRCAINTIAERGYGRASLAEIARRASVSKGVISYHFDGKDELIREVVASILGAGMAAMQPLIDAAPSALEKLHAYIRSNLAYMCDHREDMEALVEIFTANRGGGETPLLSEEMAVAGVSALRTILEQGQAEGSFSAFDVQVAAVSIRASIDAIPPYLAALPDIDLDHYADELVAMFDRVVENPTRPK